MDVESIRPDGIEDGGRIMKVIDAKSKDLKTTNGYLKKNLDGQPIAVRNARHLHGLAAGLSNGEVVVRGTAGDYVGVLNSGAQITVTRNAGNYAADNMTAGTLIIEGSAGYGVGQYCYGGTVVVKGNAGDFTGTMNKGGAIIIGGDVGTDAGTYMLKGDLVVVGNAGNNFANCLIRGTIYIHGNWASLGHNTRVEPLTEEDISKLRAYLNTYAIEATPEEFKKIVAASEKPFYN
jgi:methylamine---glutamate N-methyltransferase subunit B